jgi:adenine-specific DNA-methyltransferase
MALRKGKDGKPSRRPVERYEHRDKKRVNNPPVGLVTLETDPAAPTRKTYEYDHHLDPQLVWAGKKEHTSFEVPTISLHVHERIDPRTIIEALRKHDGQPWQPSLFERPEEILPLRDAIDFYKHANGWSNRLIAGDSLLVMNSLLEKEGMAGQVQMVYIDPPYGIKYGSNFQPFVNRRDVKDGKDEDLTQEPEMIRAFRDTWELGIHSYLAHLRDRFLLSRDLLHASGSLFVQINDVNLHHVTALLDEVFGHENRVAIISFKKTGFASDEALSTTHDFIVWTARSRETIKIRPLFGKRQLTSEELSFYDQVELTDGTRRALSREEQALGSGVRDLGKPFARNPMVSPGWLESLGYAVEFQNRSFRPAQNRHWATTREGVERLRAARRLAVKGNTLRYIRYFDDFPLQPLGTVWSDTGLADL